MDSECIDGSECKSMNITITSFKTCQCKDGYMSKDGYCSNAFYIQIPSMFTIVAVTVAHLLANKLSISF
ncbi:hypothetical protein RUM43_007438 [Polyplax serrata]|uniref:EGF-like domain-containing protein n=1 Tax=Polyplax serrata TaxID=468196 RepID=A0AAN8S1M0_POLSC